MPGSQTPGRRLWARLEAGEGPTGLLDLIMIIKVTYNNPILQKDIKKVLQLFSYSKIAFTAELTNEGKYIYLCSTIINYDN